jgi:hypothetical protein
MIVIDPAWAGKVQFYELLFGTWTVYIFLVLLWEKVLRSPLRESRYALLTFLGAGAFWINHYLQHAPLWLVLLNTYTVVFLAVWWMVGIRGRARSIFWKIRALAGGAAFTVAFIGFEQYARFVVERYGVNEFWFMAASFIGFVGLILWRGAVGNRA